MGLFWNFSSMRWRLDGLARGGGLGMNLITSRRTSSGSLFRTTCREMPILRSATSCRNCGWTMEGRGLNISQEEQMEQPSCECGEGSSATGVVNEAYAYKIFVYYGKDSSVQFATAIADVTNKYNPCLVPFAISFLQNPNAWHQTYG